MENIEDPNKLYVESHDSVQSVSTNHIIYFMKRLTFDFLEQLHSTKPQ